MPRRDVMITLDTTTQPKPECPPFAENKDVFVRAACTEFHKYAKVVKASQTQGDSRGTHNYVGNPNGLIMTVLEAYNNHRHLVLHPDDFIIAVLIQRADWRWSGSSLRGQAEAGFTIPRTDRIRPDNERDYVDVVKTVMSRFTQNTPEGLGYGPQELVKCVLNDFTLPSMEEADAHNKGSDDLFGVGSIPSVTLLGEKTDWEKLEQDFKSLLPHHTPYCKALVKLSRYFVESFEKPKDKDVILFWSLMCPQWQQEGWLAVFNTCDTSDPEMGLTYPLHLTGVGVDIKLDTYAGTIKENRVSSGYRKLKFILRHSEGKQRVTLAAGHLGTQFWSSHTRGQGVMDIVRPAGVWVVFHEDVA